MITGNLQALPQETFLQKKVEEYTKDVADSEKSFTIGLAVAAVSVGVLALGCAFPAQVQQLTSLGAYGSWTRFGAEMANLAMFIAPVVGVVKSISSKFELNDDNKDLKAILKEVEKEKNPDNKMQIGTSKKIEPHEVLYKSEETKSVLTAGKKEKIIGLSLLGVGAALIGAYNSPEIMSVVQSLGWVSKESLLFVAFGAPLVSAITFIANSENKDSNLAKERSEYINNNSDYKLATTDAVKNMQNFREKTFSTDTNNLPVPKAS